MFLYGMTICIFRAPQFLLLAGGAVYITIVLQYMCLCDMTVHILWCTVTFVPLWCHYAHTEVCIFTALQSVLLCDTHNKHLIAPQQVFVYDITMHIHGALWFMFLYNVTGMLLICALIPLLFPGAAEGEFSTETPLSARLLAHWLSHPVATGAACRIPGPAERRRTFAAGLGRDFPCSTANSKPLLWTFSSL